MNRAEDENLFSALLTDKIEITLRDIQNARNNNKETLYNIGYKYYYYKKDYPKALAWFQKAAALNYNQAQYEIGWMYESGLGTLKNNEIATAWYLKAANNENILAQTKIAFMYRNGIGVPKNIYSAIEWYTKLAIKDYTSAQFDLGWIYEYAIEVKDFQKAVNWYKKAADRGHKKAKQQLEALKEKGHYPKEEEKVQMITIKSDHKISDRTNSNETDRLQMDEHINKLIQERINKVEAAFKLKLGVLEQEFAIFKLQMRNKDKEIKHLQQSLAQYQALLEDNPENDIYYDSSNQDSESNDM